MLAANMAALQPLSTAAANKLAHAEDLAETDSAERTMNKLLRTFCNVVATFDRHRESREQKASHQQITVGAANVTDVMSSDIADRMQEPAKQIPKINSPELAPLEQGLRWCCCSDAGREQEKWPAITPVTRSDLSSPRCGAKTRSGNPCMSPAVRGKKRCRMHGGAQGSGALRGNQNALKHGLYRGNAIEGRRSLRDLIKRISKSIQSIEDE